VQGKFRWENASEKDFNRRITFCHADGRARGSGFARDNDHWFERLEFSSFAAPQQAQQELAPQSEPSPRFETAQPATVAAASAQGAGIRCALQKPKSEMQNGEPCGSPF
jgi:hypothetical protein